MSDHGTPSAEIWKDVLGYEGIYQVSSLGRVRSWLSGRWGKRKSPRILPPRRSNRFGYIFVTLCGKGLQKVVYVHRLVLETFVGPCPDGLIALHGLNGVKDNSLANLSWGTREKNNGEDRVRDGTINRGEKHPLHKLTQEDVIRVRKMLEQGMSQSEIARTVGVHQCVISRIKTGKRWGWLNHPSP